MASEIHGGLPKKDFSSRKRDVSNAIGGLLDLMDDASGSPQELLLSGYINPNQPIVLDIQFIDLVDEPQAKPFLDILVEPLTNGLENYVGLHKTEPELIHYPAIFLIDEGGDSLLPVDDWIVRIPDIHGVVLSASRMQSAVDRCSTQVELNAVIERIEE